MDQLGSYIEKEREKGFSEEKIKQTLLKSGYSKDNVDKAFGGKDTESKELDSKPSDSSDGKSEDKSDKSKPTEVKTSIIKPIIILLVIAAIVLGIFVWRIGYFENITDKTEPIGIEEDDELTSDISKSAPFPEHEGAGCEYDTKTTSRMCRAISANDIEICERIDKEIDVVFCKDMTNVINSIRNKDDSICSNLQEIPKEVCAKIIDRNNGDCDTLTGSVKLECDFFESLANGIRTKDTQACEINPSDEHTDEFYKQLCEDFIDNSPDVCDKHYDSWCS